MEALFEQIHLDESVLAILEGIGGKCTIKTLTHGTLSCKNAMFDLFVDIDESAEYDLYYLRAYYTYSYGDKRVTILTWTYTNEKEVNIVSTKMVWKLAINYPFTVDTPTCIDTFTYTNFASYVHNELEMDYDVFDEYKVLGFDFYAARQRVESTTCRYAILPIINTNIECIIDPFSGIGTLDIETYKASFMKKNAEFVSCVIEEKDSIFLTHSAEFLNANNETITIAMERRYISRDEFHERVCMQCNGKVVHIINKIRAFRWPKHPTYTMFESNKTFLSTWETSVQKCKMDKKKKCVIM